MSECNCAELAAKHAELVAQFKELEERVSRIPVKRFTDLDEPAQNPLAQWVSTQAKPFTADDAMNALGIEEADRTTSMHTRIGIALRKLGCFTVSINDGTRTYTPPATPPSASALPPPEQRPTQRLANQQPVATLHRHPEPHQSHHECRSRIVSHPADSQSHQQGDESPPTHPRSASRSAVLFVRQASLAAPFKWVRATLARIAGSKS